MVRTLVVEHDPLSTSERVGAHLEKRGARLESFVVVEDIGDPSVGNVFPDDVYDLVVLMGSPWSVYEDRVQGWVQPELAFIQRRVEAGRPLLGICFGAQAISASLGGSVRHSSRPEYGWTEIAPSTDHIAAGPWFQFHHDEFTLPPQAIELARNESGVQAFRIGRALATQFHPEMTGDLLASWCEIEDGATELVDAGHDPALLIEESRAREIESQPALEAMLDWFLDEVAGNGVSARAGTPQDSTQMAG